MLDTSIGHDPSREPSQDGIYKFSTSSREFRSKSRNWIHTKDIGSSDICWF